MKVVIVGGIATGLSAASQIKRQAPDSQVVVFEKSGDISYAACGISVRSLTSFTGSTHTN
jgi:CoA-dependent NAD(P)H sulfur oxidoreductase